MNYAISPLWIYLYELVGSLNEFAFAIALIASLATCVIMICYLINAIEYKGSLSKQLIVYGKRLLAITIVAALSAALIPSQDTLIYMQIAKFSTADNIETVVESTKNAVNYVVDTIKELKES